MKLRLGMAFLCLVFCTGFSLSFETSWKDVKKSVLKKNTKKAISQIKKIKAKEPMLGLKHFALGYLLFEDGNYSESQWHLKQYFFYDEMMSSYAHYYLGAIAFKNKKFSESQKYFQQALKQKIHRFLKRDIELSLAKVHMKMKRYSSARLSLKKLEKKWRRTDLYPDILQELVLVEYHRKQKSKACHWLQKIYRDYPYKEEVKVSNGKLQMENLNLKCLVTLGDQKKRIRSLQWSGRFDQAQKEIDSLRKKPSSFTDYELDFLQAYHWTYEGHPDKALNILKKHQKNKWSHWEYLTFLGKVAVKLQDAELSLKAFHRAYEIAKSRKRKKEALYDVAFIAYQFKRYDMASKKFLSFYKKYPMRESTKVNVLWYVSWTHFLNNKFKESISYFDKLLSIYKKSRKDYSFQEERASYWKSLAHVEMGQYDKAQELLMRISQNSLMTYYSFLSYYRLRNISHKVPLKISLMKGSSVSDFINYQEEIKSVMRSLSSLDEINNVQYEKSLFESETKPSGNPENDESVEESFLSFNNFKRKTFKKNKIFLERGKILKSLGFYKQARYEFYEVEFNTSDLSLLRLLMENYEEIESFHRSAYIAEVYFQKPEDNMDLKEVVNFGLTHTLKFMKRTFLKTLVTFYFLKKFYGVLLEQRHFTVLMLSLL